MLEFGWGNPPTIMLSGDDETTSSHETDPNHQIFGHYGQHSFNNNHHHSLIDPHHSTNNLFHQTGFYDPRAYTGASSYNVPQHSILDTMGDGGGSGGNSDDIGRYYVVPKTEEVPDFTARIGLNLGGRTYFSSAEDDFVNRMYRRSRPVEPGTSNFPRCQAEGCNADLTHAKHYHRRHKVCEYHSKAATVMAAGLTQRFCQQCSRFHLLSEFDNGKRSCRRRLADHNRRRRKSYQPNQENQKSQPESSSVSRSPQDSSGAHSNSSVTVAVSPPRMSLDCYQQRCYQGSGSTSASSSPHFFSSG